MQILSDRVRQWEGSFRDPSLNFEFFAGRTKSGEMLEHGKKVFERAFEMVNNAEKIAEKSGDKELLDKIRKLKGIWRERAWEGVTELGVNEIKMALGQTTSTSSPTNFSAIANAINTSNVRDVARGIQGVLDPYAREIWGEGGRAVEELDNLSEESKQYLNKSEAILKAPLWRRGLEYIWQSFGRIPGILNNTEMQLEELRSTVNRIYESETNGEKEIGNWFKNYAHKTFIAHVFAKARETGSIGDIKTTLEHALKNPHAYSSYSWKEEDIEVVNHFRSDAKNIGGILDKIESSDDPRIPQLNYASIELTKAINGMGKRIRKGSNLEDVIEEYHADFEKAAVRLKLNLQYIGDIGAYDYEKHKAEEALDHLKEYFRNSIAHSRTNPFKDDKEIEDFFVSIKPQFIDSYAKKEIIFKKLLRTEVPKETLGESSAPVLW